MKYAVIIADINSGGIGRVISNHRTERAAFKAQPDVFGAYVAHRLPSGEYESRLEARDRRDGGEQVLHRGPKGADKQHRAERVY